MKNVQIKIEDIDFTKPKKYYCAIYGLSENALRNRFKKLGILDRFTTSRGDNMKILHGEFRDNYEKSPKLCKECYSKIDYKKRGNCFCSHECAAIFSQREFPRKMSEEQKIILSKIAKQNYKYNPVKRIEIKCGFCKNMFEVLPCHNKRKFCSKRCSNSGSDNSNRGGYRKEAGRGKMGWYKGYYCNSTWELAWVIFQLEHGVKFERNSIGFKYLFNNKIMKFYPDFKLSDGTYVEIKGWITPKDVEKIAQFKHPLIVLKEKEIRPIINYVVEKYGASYYSLYEKA